MANSWAKRRKSLQGGTPDDVVLAERVRAQLGRWLAYPQGVAVSADRGVVTLSGHALAGERPQALAAAAAVRGVRLVKDALGGPEEPSRPHQLVALPRRWPAGWRLVAAGVGLGLALAAGARRGPTRLTLGAAGLAVFARALSDRPLLALVGLGEVEAERISATVRIDAPIDRVFTAWRDLERFPRFMHHVRDVVVYGDGRSSCWLVIGPAGVPFEFDAMISELTPNDTIAWHSLPGSAVKHHGVVRFQPDGDQATRVHVQIAYEAPAGAFGQLIAASLGSDPARWLRADLQRMKRQLEAEAGRLAPLASGDPDHQIRTRSAGAL